MNASADMSSLYDQIGGDRLYAIVTDFQNRIFADPMLCFLFAGKNKQRLIQKEWEFTANLLGGPIEYTGRPIRAAHSHSPILEGHFYRRFQILQQTLIDHQVPEAAAIVWLQHTAELQPRLKYAIARSILPQQFELFIGTPQQRETWKQQGISQKLRDLRDWILSKSQQNVTQTAPEIEQWVNQRLRDMTAQLLTFEFDAAVATLMQFLDWLAQPQQRHLPVSQETLRAIVIALTAVAPRMTEKVWEDMGEPGLVYEQPYPIQPDVLIPVNAMNQC